MDLYNNNISDLSPLSGLINLWEMDLYNNNISDLSPLSGLINLWELDLYNNIGDIGPLSELTRLEKLYLEGNHVHDVGPLSGLTNLEYLGLISNDISDFSPLSGLTELQQLRLDDNRIGDLSILAVLTNVKTLDLMDNKIRDISSLSEWINLERLYLDYNNINDIQPLLDNPGLGSGDYVSLRGNPLSDADISALEAKGVNVFFYTNIDTNLIWVIEGWNLSKGTENSLLSILLDAYKAATEGGFQAMVEYLETFIDQCEKMRGTKLTDEQADELIEKAEYIIRD